MYVIDMFSCAPTTANMQTGGGMPTSRNRTKWPIKGGAVSVQPGWFPGHSLAQIYINMGYGNEPLNYSHTMLPVFQITGPSNQQYEGQFCLPQVPLPANYTPKVGDNATIQVIELAQHGAALYNVSFALLERLWMLLTSSIVRRYYLCRARRRPRSQPNKLPKHNRPRPAHWLPGLVRNNIIASATHHRHQRLRVDTRTGNVCRSILADMGHVRC